MGKASDDKGVAVTSEILAKYAGTYRFTDPVTHELVDFIFKFDTDHPVLSGVGPTEKLIAVSETEFSAPNAHINLKFEKNDAGVVSEVAIQAVEGNFKAVRK